MKRRPRVMHLTTVHHAYDPRILQREARSLAEGGYEVHLLARHEKAEYWEGVRIHPLPQVSGRMRRLLLTYPFRSLPQEESQGPGDL